MNGTIDKVYWPLRLTYGLVPLLAGLDKFVGLLADWESYLAPWMADLLPVSPGTFMAIVGIIEIVAGLAVLTRWTRLGAYVVAAWLVLIALQLVTAGIYDVAVRDLVMAVGAWTLAKVAEARETAPAASGASTRPATA